MGSFATPPWLDAFNRDLSQVRVPAVERRPRLVLQQIVTEDATDAGERAWHLIVDGDRVSAHPGRAAAPDLTFTQDHATAAAVHRGELSAQTAFMLGRIRVGGDTTLLTGSQELLTALAEAYSEVRTDPDDDAADAAAHPGGKQELGDQLRT